MISTIIGTAFVTLLRLIDLIIKRLWHMSAMGLIELFKRGLLDGYSTSKICFYEEYVFGT